MKKLLIAIGILLAVVIIAVGAFIVLREEDTPPEDESVDVEPLNGWNDLENDNDREERDDKEKENGDREEEPNDDAVENGETVSLENDAPEPIIYTGEGDDDFGIEKPEEGAFLLYIEGNSKEEHFKVTGIHALPTYYGGKRPTHLFVNTFREYSGIVLDWEGRTNELEVVAEGSWRIEVRSLQSAKKVEIPGSIEGEGDNVLRIEGEPSRADITGNLGAGDDPEYFEVIAYNTTKEVIVETDSPYEDMVEISPDTSLLEITARGSWEIGLE